jgi:hypothetical protein
MAKRSATKGKAVRSDVLAAPSRVAVERTVSGKAMDRVSYARLLDQVEADKQPRRVPGRKVAVVALSDLRRLRALQREDREDVAAIEDAMRDTRPSIPWEMVKAELGL